MLWSPVSGYLQYCYCSKMCFMFLWYSICIWNLCFLLYAALSFLENRYLTLYPNSNERICPNLIPMDPISNYSPTQISRQLFLPTQIENVRQQKEFYCYIFVWYIIALLSLFCIQRHIILYILFICTFNKQYIPYHSI